MKGSSLILKLLAGICCMTVCDLCLNVAICLSLDLTPSSRPPPPPGVHVMLSPLQPPPPPLAIPPYDDAGHENASPSLFFGELPMLHPPPLSSRSSILFQQATPAPRLSGPTAGLVGPTDRGATPDYCERLQLLKSHPVQNDPAAPMSSSQLHVETQPCVPPAGSVSKTKKKRLRQTVYY